MAIWRSSGKGPFGPLAHTARPAGALDLSRHVEASGRCNPRPTTLPSLTSIETSARLNAAASGPHTVKNTPPPRCCVVDPPGEAFGPTLGLAAIGHVGWRCGAAACAVLPTMPLMSAARVVRCLATWPVGCARIALCQGVTYGTIPTRLSTHRLASWFSFFLKMA